MIEMIPFIVSEKNGIISNTSFKINNWNKVLNWEIRKANFGTFCREDLIDNEEHWENVGVILSKNTSYDISLLWPA